MSSTFESIKKGLEEAVAYSQGKPVEVRTYHPQPVDVKSVRLQTKLTLNEFAATFGISVSTLRPGSAEIENPKARRWSCSIWSKNHPIPR